MISELHKFLKRLHYLLIVVQKCASGGGFFSYKLSHIFLAGIRVEL